MNEYLYPIKSKKQLRNHIGQCLSDLCKEIQNCCIKLYDRRDDVDFSIVKFPFLSNNIPSAPTYDSYISQSLIYFSICSVYSNLMERHIVLTTILINQGVTIKGMSRSFQKVYKDIQRNLPNTIDRFSTYPPLYLI